MSQTAPLPHWQLTSIFPGLDSPEFNEAKRELKVRLESLTRLMDENKVGAQDAKEEPCYGDARNRLPCSTN